MDRDWTFEACCSRGWAALVLCLALSVMGAGLLAAGWGLIHLDDGTSAVIIAAVGGTLVMFVFGAAALIAFADLVRPREPVVVVDAFGILDRRVTACIIPWSAIREARRQGRHVALDVEKSEAFLPAPSGLYARFLRGSRGAITISPRGLACAADEIEAAVNHGLRYKAAAETA